MKYKAVFDIPDGYTIGCAIAKICPDDGEIRCDQDFETVYADTVPMTESPKVTFRIDCMLTEKELEKLKKEMANAPIVLLPRGG